MPITQTEPTTLMNSIIRTECGTVCRKGNELENHSDQTVDALLQRAMTLKPDLKWHHKDEWCRYCGARGSSAFYDSMWGPNTLCHQHHSQWNLGKLDLTEMSHPIDRNLAINRGECTERQYLIDVIHSYRTTSEEVSESEEETSVSDSDSFNSDGVEDDDYTDGDESESDSSELDISLNPFAQKHPEIPQMLKVMRDPILRPLIPKEALNGPKVFIYCRHLQTNDHMVVCGVHYVTLDNPQKDKTLSARHKCIAIGKLKTMTKDHTNTKCTNAGCKRGSICCMRAAAAHEIAQFIKDSKAANLDIFASGKRITSRCLYTGRLVGRNEWTENPRKVQLTEDEQKVNGEWLKLKLSTKQASSCTKSQCKALLRILLISNLFNVHFLSSLSYDSDGKIYGMGNKKYIKLLQHALDKYTPQSMKYDIHHVAKNHGDARTSNECIYCEPDNQCISDLFQEHRDMKPDSNRKNNNVFGKYIVSLSLTEGAFIKLSIMMHSWLCHSKSLCKTTGINHREKCIGKKRSRVYDSDESVCS